MSSATGIEPKSSLAARARYGVLIAALLFAIGAAAQLFLAGLSTFDTGLYWDDHVILGRAVSLFAFVLPVLAVIGRLGRWFIALSAIGAVLYLVQVMLTMVDIGPLAALHALNALPLIVIPALLAMRTLEAIRNREPQAP